MRKTVSEQVFDHNDVQRMKNERCVPDPGCLPALWSRVCSPLSACFPAPLTHSSADRTGNLIPSLAGKWIKEVGPFWAFGREET